ncbi:hypothetical protein [Flavivirga jejuensis]|uniref:Uncharacterized protein n=1 Tax=Flavivirga jejuensis TaxID=870487 RepID=A0ABT8WV88_9FLAO|nr:hypothetical protein [Flavivirga jejuensis]MDO5977098.1 hypothetical protein [Flavivirga jejuensis]
MIIPNLPTDNIYKFFALSGLFIIIFCITSTELKVSDIESDMDNLITQKGEIEYEIQLLKNNYEKEKLNEKLNLKIFKFNRLDELLQNKTKKIKRVFYWSIFGIIVGVIMCLFGFVCWYNRIQIFLDYKLKKENEALINKV